MNSNNRRNARFAAAIVGGTALVAFGVTGVEMAQQQGQDAATSAGATVNPVPESTTASLGVVEQTVDTFVPPVKASQTYGPGEVPNNMPVS